VTPENLAIAINEECTSCDTLASAYQYVTTAGGVVHFDAEGNQELAAIRREFRALSHRTDLGIEDIQAEVDALVQRLYAVVDGHLVASGPALQAPQATPTTEPSAPAEPSPSETSPSETSPSPSESPADSPSPSPSSTEAP
jgi:hypothetical protein